MASYGVQHHTGDNEQIEVIRTPSLGLLLTCGTGNNSFVLSHSEDDDEEDESRDEQPNRRNSLMEEDDDDDDEEEGVEVESLGVPNEIVKSPPSLDDKRNYHPALKPAVLAEGQEAMWVEDDVSTVASVTVKPPQPAGKPKRKNRFRFRNFAPAITIPEDEELQNDEDNTHKLHVRKTKVRKTVVLLPQQGDDDGAKTLVEANVKQEAAVKMVQARQLLNQALVAENCSSLEDSEAMAKVAFAHAADARRLMSKPEEEPDLEDVLSVLAEKGEQAFSEHQKIIFSQSFESQSIETPKEKKKGVLASAAEYANRAIHYLESMLPTNLEKELQESTTEEDILAMATISTLGMKNDTFEYNLNPAPSHPTKSYTNMDLMSISSLNEILDGPMDDANEGKPPSPRQVLPVIRIPNHTPRTKPSSRSVRQSVSGELKKWVSPRSPFISRPTRSEVSGQETTVQQNDADLVTQEAPAKIEEEAPQIKPKKSWKLLGKLRRSKNSKKETTEAEEEMESKLSSEESEIKPKDPNAIDSLPTGPSKSFESDDRTSKLSRYHVVRENASGDTGSTTSGLTFQDNGSPCMNTNTAKSDWDVSLSFERVKVKSLVDNDVILAPSRSRSGDLVRDPSGNNLDRAGSDWDESLDPNAKRMQKKKAMAARTSEGGRSGVDKADKHPAPTPTSQFGASTDSRRTKDIRSVQANTGASIAETETEVMTRRTKEESLHQAGETDTQASVTEASGSKARSNQSTTNVSQMPVYKKMREPLISDESTQAGKDSLINFVISPRRANIITPEGRTHIETDRGDEPSKILIPTLHAISEDYIHEVTTTSVDEEYSDMPSNTHDAKSNKPPKIISRLSGLFGTRKGRGHSKSESFDIEKRDSVDKDIDRAVSDGNGMAYEANLNAENASSSVSRKHIYQKPSAGIPESVEQQSKESTTIVSIQDGPMGETPTMIEEALNHAMTKAQEANLEVETAPFPHKKTRRHKQPSRPVPLDLVDAIRMQTGLERNKNNGREKISDAPGTSMQVETAANTDPPLLDPPKDEGNGYRVLAPTPRKKHFEGEGEVLVEKNPTSTSFDEKPEDDGKLNQRKISELMYGPSTSTDEDFIRHPPNKKVATKGVYIGDLIGASETSKPTEITETKEEEVEGLPTTDESQEEEDVNDENITHSEDADAVPNKENEFVLVSPKTDDSTTPRRRFGLKAPRKSLLYGIRNLMSSEQ